jgi:hypothetical protein
LDVVVNHVSGLLGYVTLVAAIVAIMALLVRAS